ncbi:HigA family addiction module antitoxin [Zooshikella ganghwensis]|uniref:Addiction module antidote protein, HigA family n=1 Tax=Zooshikella ganghwensis TaxID=202772 RepID=A0A4V1IP68_9GAMM|nr:HigA family addiction module antitoxin [Zooshikella ganghwensis]RDH46181.1 addiction module antidote protein, HigA family [Zooshikella ganghwensis]
MMHSPPHPGEIIKDSYLDELNISINYLAKQLGVNPSTLSRLVDSKSSISPEMAIRLSKVLNGSPEFWLNLQQSYNLWQASQTNDFAGVRKLEQLSEQRI